MRVELITQVGLTMPGTVVDLNYTAATNLIYFGRAKAVEESSNDKMVRAERSSHKGKSRGKGKANGRVTKDQNAPDIRPDADGAGVSS